MGDLFTPTCSITSTQRRRFFWAAWWTEPPRRVPFRKPDASGGGAATYDAARAAAEAAAGRALAVGDPLWAKAWMRVLRGQPLWPSKASEEGRRAPRAGAGPASEAGEDGAPSAADGAPPGSIWAELGVASSATLDEIRAAYRKRAQATHPDRGGDAASFRKVVAAYEEAARRAKKPQRKGKRGGS